MLPSISAASNTLADVAQSKGVSIKQMYWTLGQYDQVCVFDARVFCGLDTLISELHQTDVCRHDVILQAFSVSFRPDDVNPRLGLPTPSVKCQEQ